ncbi:MAG TPA: hypothetical protein VNT52_00885 [Acidimicrobiales bacterium]|nr:hypothetical protein [Acidimicrobiales bacterium]
MTGRPFPVPYPPPDCPASVVWSSLNNDRAVADHGQSLGKLAKLGGMTPVEIFANVRGVPERSVDRAEAVDLCKRIAHDGEEA